MICNLVGILQQRIILFVFGVWTIDRVFRVLTAIGDGGIFSLVYQACEQLSITCISAFHFICFVVAFGCGEILCSAKIWVNVQDICPVGCSLFLVVTDDGR